MSRKICFLLILVFFNLHEVIAQWQPVRMPYGLNGNRGIIQDSVLLLCSRLYPMEYHIFRTPDLGNNWTILPDSMSQDCFIFREADGYIFGYSLDQSIISNDGGLNWNFLGKPDDPDLKGFPKTIVHDTLLFCDGYGTVIRRFPDGNRDTVFVDPNGQAVYILERFGKRLLRASLSGISYSDDSGNSWQSAGGVPNLLPMEPIYEMQIARQGTRAFILVHGTKNDLLLRSEDMGASWQEDAFFVSAGCNKLRLWATSKAVYFRTDCAGPGGPSPSELWRMTPANSEWQQYMPPRSHLYPIAETDSFILGAYQWDGTLYRGTSQGINWDVISPGEGRVFKPTVFYHWPDGRSLTWDDTGWHLKKDSAAMYRYLPRVYNCVEQAVQRGDSVFAVCAVPHGIVFTPDRGESWDTLLPYTPLSYIKIEKLVWDAEGIFAQIANPVNNTRRLGRWSFVQNDWTDLKDFPDGVQDWAKAGGKLYALVDDIGGGKIFVSADAGSTWNLVINMPPGAYINRIEDGGDALFAIDAHINRVYRTDNSGQTWDQLPEIYHPVFWLPIAPEKILTAPDGMLFMIASNLFLFSEDGGFNWVHMSDPVNLPNLNHEILRIGSDEQVYLVSNHTLLRRPTSDFRKLVARARVLWDANGNGIADPSDPPAFGIPVSSAWNTVVTDSAGVTRVGLRSDFLEDTLYVFPYLPNISVSPVFHPVNDPGAVYTFLLTPEKPRYQEVHLQAYQPPRPGFTATYQVQVANYGAQPESGRLKLVLDPQMQWLDATPAPYATAGDTLYWQIDNLKPWKVFQASVIAELSASAPLGEQVQLIAGMEVDSSLSGWTIAASDTLWALIVGAYDPNDKQVEPAGNLSPERVADGLDLVYTVRFQNTGTYLAENVLVVDTLPAGLDVRTFRFLGASHPCEVRLKASNILEFYFKNIQLPDSNANEPASHGFLRFSIRPFTTLALGTVIRNEADIYFDFNPPIRTNAAVNNIVLSNREAPTAAFIPLQCHPNPARSEIWIDWPEYRDAQARLYRWDGALMGVFPLQAHKKNRLGIGHLPAGMYGVQVVFENRLFGGRFVKI